MSSENIKFPVEAIEKGIVIDHIPAGQGINILKQLHLLDSNSHITVGLNFPSKAITTKDLIKVSNRFLKENEIEKISVFAPHATINYIEGYKVTMKKNMALPKRIKGIFSCPNDSCITLDEPIDSNFIVHKQQDKISMTCFFCEKKYAWDIFVKKLS